MSIFRRRHPPDEPVDRTRMEVEDRPMRNAALEEQHDLQDLADAHERLTALRYRFGTIAQSARGPE